MDFAFECEKTWILMPDSSQHMDMRSIVAQTTYIGTMTFPTQGTTR